MANMKSAILSISLLFAVAAWADEPQPVVIVRAAQMLDVKTGKLIENPVVSVQGEKVISLAGAEIPKDAKIIELPGHTLLPGLIDMVHSR